MPKIEVTKLLPGMKLSKMTEVASVMKMRAKESGGSCVMNDRRRA